MIYGQRIRNDAGKLVRRKVRASPMKTSSGFRLIRAFNPDHNAARFRRHVDDLMRQFRRGREHQRFRLRIRRRRRAEAAARAQP